MKNILSLLIASLVCFTTSSLLSYQEPLSEITNSQDFKALYPHLNNYEVAPNPNVTRFFLVRHGENVANAQGLIDGRTLNLPLTDKGIKDAQSAGESLVKKIENIDLLVSSPLVRTQQTACEVLKAFKKTPQIILDDRLMERYHGIFEGQHTSTFKPYEEAAAHAIPLLSTFLKKLHYREHPSMENYLETYQRMSATLLELSQNHLGENIVISTHGNAIRSLFLMGNAEQHNVFVPNARFKPTNGCILIIESDGKTLSIKACQGLEFQRDPV